mgnify:FL=1
MKYLVKFFVVTFLLLTCTYASAEQKVAYMDLKFVLNNSMAGKGALGKITEMIKENQKKIFDLGEELKKEEADLLAVKQDLTEKEYKKKKNELRKKVNNYQKQRRTSQDSLNKKYHEARLTLIKKIDPILNAYMTENGILLVIDKKSVLGGNTDLNITNTIIEKLNKELPSLSIK